MVKAGVHSCSPVAPQSKASDALFVVGVPTTVPKTLKPPDALIMRLRLVILPEIKLVCGYLDKTRYVKYSKNIK